MGLRHLFLVALLVAVAPLQAQFLEVGSFEVVLRQDEDPYFAINGWEHGLLLYRQINKDYSYTEKTWEILLLDSAFNGQWATTLSTEYSQQIIGAYVDGDYGYFLLVDYSKSRRDYQIIRLDFASKQLLYFELGEYVPENLIFLRIHHGLIIIGGTEKNRPSVVCYRFGDKRAVVLQGVYGRNNVLLEIELLEKEGFLLYLRIKSENNQYSLSVNAYTDAGELKSTIVIKGGAGRNLLDCRVMSDLEADQPPCLAGTYSIGKSLTANGLFTVLLHPDGRQEFKYYGFDNLKNFFGYLSPEAEARELAKIGLKKSKGKKDVYDVNVSIRAPLVASNEGVFIGECYTQTNQSINPYYGLQTRFNYSHGFFVGIKKNGMVSWDNALVIDKTYESSELQQTFVAEVSDGYVSFTYKKNTLFYKVFDQSGGISSMATFPLSTDIDLDLSLISERESVVVMRPWYNKNYLIFGVNHYESGMNHPPVFFMKKISIGN